MPSKAKKIDNGLTDEENEAIRALELLAQKWPKSLWLFASGKTLHVLQCDENGERQVRSEERGGGYNPLAIVNQVFIPNDGGEF